MTQTFVAVHVKNVGVRDTNAAEGAIAVALLINGEAHAIKSIGARLLVQEERHVMFSVAQFAAAGEYRIDAVADPEQRIAELSDANDSLTQIVTVVNRAAGGIAPGWSGMPVLIGDSARTHSSALAPVTVDATVPADPQPALTPAATDAAAIATIDPVLPAIETAPIPIVEDVATPEPAGGAMVPETGLPNTAKPDWVESDPLASPPAPIAAARLSGIISAADNNSPVSGAAVAVYDAFGQLADWRITGGDGSYITRDLPPGDYQVVVSRNAGWRDTIYRDTPIAKYGRIMLRHGESHRFSTGVTHDAAGGDFYFGFFNHRPQFWSNHENQRGVMALGDIRSTPLEIIVPPSADCAEPNPWLARIATPCYSRGGIDAVLNHTYIALSRDAGTFIIFRVVDVQPGVWVQLSYVVSSGVARGNAVTVTDGGVTAGVDQLLARVPSILSVAPDHGSAAGGNEVVITGINFQHGAVVSFGGVVASDVRVVSPSLIVAVAPANPGGAADIEVWNPDGVMSSADLAYRFEVPGPAAFAKNVMAAVAISNPSVVLEWEPSAEAVQYQICIDTTDDQQCTLEASPSYGWATIGASPSVALWRHAFSPGITYYWQVRAVGVGGITEADAGLWSSFTVANVAIAELLSPQPGSTLIASMSRFEWTAGTGVEAYRLEIGSVPGGVDLFAGSTTARSMTVALPYDGRALFVRLGSLINGDWLFRDYVYTASSTLIPKLGLGEGGPNGGRVPR